MRWSRSGRGRRRGAGDRCRTGRGTVVLAGASGRENRPGRQPGAGDADTSGRAGGCPGRGGWTTPSSGTAADHPGSGTHRHSRNSPRPAVAVMPKLSDAEWSPWLSCRRCSGTPARPSGLWHAKCHLYQTFPYLPSQSDCNHVEAGTVTPPGGIDDWHILEDVPPTDPRPLILLGTPVGGGASRHRPGGRRRRGPDGSVAGAAFTPHPASTAPVRASKADLRDRSAAVTECRLPRGRMSGWVLRRGWG